MSGLVQKTAMDQNKSKIRNYVDTDDDMDYDTKDRLICRGMEKDEYRYQYSCSIQQYRRILNPVDSMKLRLNVAHTSAIVCNQLLVIKVHLNVVEFGDYSGEF